MELAKASGTFRRPFFMTYFHVIKIFFSINGELCVDEFIIK